MNTETNAAAPSFTSHLLASDKREWSITVDGVPFVIARSTPDADGWQQYYTNTNRIMEVWDNWTLFVVTTSDERVEIAQSTGMITTRKSDESSRTASHAALSLAKLMEAARTYVEGLARLAVMLDKLMSENDLRKAGKKAQKLREAAAVQLHSRRVLVQDQGRTVSLVAGDAVLIVSKQYSGEWNELTYRVGDRAVHGSYNLVYTGTITSISPKTITVVESHGSKTHRMTHERFVGRNTTKMEVHDKRNSEWMD